MCGIAGFLDPKGFDPYEARKIGDAMGRAIEHRGPDSWGVWLDQDPGVCLVHRRLAVIDVSDAGSQPMLSSTGRYVISYNGELYNQAELKEGLAKSGWTSEWRGHSDTETLLACVETYGVERTLSKIVGMYAIALWDRRERSFILARDRLGEKPLYFGLQNNRWFFTSELKALIQNPYFVPHIDRNAICLQLRYGYIPAPYTIYQGIHKLSPGSFLRLDDSSYVKPYWSYADAVLAGKRNPVCGSDRERLDFLDKELSQSIRSQMQADVPLGAFLSGGVDSSLIVAMMQEYSTSKIRTFSIGFEDEQFDEAPFARAVADHVGTEHTELYVSGAQALGIVPRLSEIYDEPFSDPSQIPTVLVSQMARQYVTVSLSGDGGDEIFGGYNRYRLGEKLWGSIKAIPAPVRISLAGILSVLPEPVIALGLNSITRLSPDKFRRLNPEARLLQFRSLLAAQNQMEMYLALVSHIQSIDDLVIGGIEPEVILDQAKGSPLECCLDFTEVMKEFDAKTYLPDDILTKVDRAAMSVSLETRAPFMDHRLIEAAWRLPIDMKLRNGVGKWCLRELLYRRVPKKIIERPKRGFNVPLDSWLRNELKDWAQDLLDPIRLKRSGYLEADRVQAIWSEHVSGRRSWGAHLWDILMFESWREKNGL